jgi:hypothetical protein
MTENQKGPQKECRSFFENMPFAKMMQKMMDPKEGCCGFRCSEMMPQMMKIGSKWRAEKEKGPKEPKEGQKANP